MLIKLFSDIGGTVINFINVTWKVIYFVIEIFIHMLQPKSYNSAMRIVLVKQIYFTAVQLLPLFLIMGMLFGSVIIGAVISTSLHYGLEQSIGYIIITFAVDKFSVLFTALFIAIRSGAAVCTEIAVMSVHKELSFLKAYKIYLIDYLYVPRIINGIISMIILSILFAITMTLSGYITVLFLLNMNFDSYLSLLFNALELENIIFLLVKSVIYGFVIMSISIYSGLKAHIAYTTIPIAVLNGMVKLFLAIFFVEVLSLIIQFN